MTSLIKLRQLSPTVRGLLFRAVVLLPVIHSCLALMGYHRLRRILESLNHLRDGIPIHSEAEVMEQAQAIYRVVEIASGRGFYKATCLRKSLLMWWFLRERGIQSEVCFGVRKAGDQLEAHAWVERNGIVLNDPSGIHEHYQPLRDNFPPVKSGL